MLVYQWVWVICWQLSPGGIHDFYHSNSAVPAGQFMEPRQCGHQYGRISRPLDDMWLELVWILQSLDWLTFYRKAVFFNPGHLMLLRVSRKVAKWQLPMYLKWTDQGGDFWDPLWKCGILQYPISIYYSPAVCSMYFSSLYRIDAGGKPNLKLGNHQLLLRRRPNFFERCSTVTLQAKNVSMFALIRDCPVNRGIVVTVMWQ